MKLPMTMSALAIAAALTSCTGETTEYNGFIKNSTSNTIHVELVGENLLLDTAYISAGSTRKVQFNSEEGDFELYDCSSFFDTIYYDAGNGSEMILPSDATIGSISDLGSDGTRIHECTVEIK